MSSEFYQPENLNEALKYMRDNVGATILAGGTDLVVAMHKDKGPKKNMIDLSKVKELKKIQVQNDEIYIGPMATFTCIENSDILIKKVKLLCMASGAVGSPQIRNRGTIGGNICNASGAADLVTPLVCLQAKVELKSMITNGGIQRRIIDIEDFVVESGKTLLGKNEILTNIVLNIPADDIKMDFKKIGRRNVLSIARLNGSCLLKINNNKVTQINLVIGSATSKPERIFAVEDYLTGKKLNGEELKEAGILTSNIILKLTGRRVTSDYKIPVIARFTTSLIENTLHKED